MRSVLTVGLLALGVGVTGCASVAGGNVQKMYVQTQMPDGQAVADADCALQNDKGVWRIKSPGDTSIVRSNKSMEIKCVKAPLPAGVVSAESSTRGAMFGNILIGGVIGAAVDHSSGAAYEYPEMIKVVMGQSLAATMPKDPPGGQANASKTQSAAVSSLPANTPATPRPVVPVIATGFAAIDDVDAIPYLGDRGRARYREYLARPTPKAFAITPTGYFSYANGLKPATPGDPSDPAARALAVCERLGQGPCKLYAVNSSVVWARELPSTTAGDKPDVAVSTSTAR